MVWPPYVYVPLSGSVFPSCPGQKKGDYEKERPRTLLAPDSPAHSDKVKHINRTVGYHFLDLADPRVPSQKLSLGQSSYLLKVRSFDVQSLVLDAAGQP